MDTRRTAADDEVDRQTILSYVRTRPGESCEEAEISRATGVGRAAFGGWCAMFLELTKPNSTLAWFVGTRPMLRNDRSLYGLSKATAH